MAVAGMSFYAASGDDGVVGLPSQPRLQRLRGRRSRPCSRMPPASAAPTSNPALRATETVWGGHGAVGRRRGRRRLALVHDAELAEGHGRDPQRPVEQDQVRRQDALSAARCRTSRSTPIPTPGTSSTASDDGGWDVVGGTSAAAPLMAAFTADANHFSLANGGSGWASQIRSCTTSSPPTRAMFHDVTAGNNNILGGSTYTAGSGYDLATGLGSVNVNTMATSSAGLHALGGAHPRHQDHRVARASTRSRPAIRRSCRAS